MYLQSKMSITILINFPCKSFICTVVGFAWAIRFLSQLQRRPCDMQEGVTGKWQYIGMYDKTMSAMLWTPFENILQPSPTKLLICSRCEVYIRILLSPFNVSTVAPLFFSNCKFPNDILSKTKLPNAKLHADCSTKCRTYWTGLN
jgi:hypothetical protein